MTHLIARLILAMLILPITGAVFVLLMAALSAVAPSGPTVPAIIFTWSLVYGFIAAYWVFLWRPVVRWNRNRTILTSLAGAGAIAVGAIVALCFHAFAKIPTEPAMLIAGGVPPIAWVLATVFLWRESPRERYERISAAGVKAVLCPICGYNLTGLRETRCPECGTAFTLEQLVAALNRNDPRDMQS